MADRIQCAECKNIVIKADGIEYTTQTAKTRFFHPDCFAKFKAREDLQVYICRLFGLKAPGPANNILRKRFIEQFNYTDKGILQTLQYAYEVKKMGKAKAESRIGIVPYLYAEAQEYFEKVKYKKSHIAESVAAAIENQKVQKVTINPNKHLPKKQLMDLTELYKEEEYWD